MLFVQHLHLLVLAAITPWVIQPSRSDPVEGSRLLEEAFRDYDKRIRPNYGGSPVAVNVSIHVLSISKIDVSKMTYTMSFFVRQMWVDPRLSFNSRRNIETIMLDASTSERLPLWIPDTYFVNELLAVEHEMLVRNQFCRISQDGTVLLSRRVTLTAFSPMNPNLFPYDSHKLRLHLESYGSQIKDMTYHWAPERVSTADYVNAPGFFVSDFLATNSSGTTSTGSYSRLTIEIDVKRNPLPHELGLLLPLCLLSILCLCTTWIQEPIYGSVVAVYLVSVIAILYGTFILNDDGNIPCMTPLHIYALLSCGLGFGCLLCNLIRRNFKPNSCEKSSGEINESKSRTESTSENCKPDELHGTVISSLGTSNMKAESDGKKWSKMLRCTTKCRSNCRLDKVARWALTLILLLFNVGFFLIYRLSHLL